MQILLLFLISTRFILCLAGRDFYKILGVSKTAETQDIKRAYRSKSKQLHPDVNKAADASEKFAEIARAYEVLADPALRKKYDRGGEEALDRSPDAGFDPFDIFSRFNFEPNSRRKSAAIQLPLRISLKTFFVGETLSASFTRPVVCINADQCSDKRNDCEGPGVAARSQAMGRGFYVQTQVHDDTCVARGKGWKKNCKACPDGVQELERITLDIEIKPGMPFEKAIVFDEMGAHKLDEIPGDLIVILNPIQHERFTRVGHDLHYSHVITLLESLTGFSHQFKHADDVTDLLLDIKGVTPNGHVIVLKDKGMPKYHTKGFGDMLVLIEVAFPRSLTSSQQKKVEEALSGLTNHGTPLDVCSFKKME